MNDYVDVNEIALKDKILVCLDCKSEFVWCVGEQRYYLGRDLSEPRRCSECRLRRKLRTVRKSTNEAERAEVVGK